MKIEQIVDWIFRVLAVSGAASFAWQIYQQWTNGTASL
jgi:hypothetical protein